MSIPNKPGKLDGKAIIEPSGVIEERKKSGLHPSGPVPDGAIICYDSALWKWISTRPERIECDGWLNGSYLLPCNDAWILVSKAAGFGAPTAVMTLEELAAYGIRNFINLGAAGGLQANMNIGDIVICEKAIRDEGTSHHYLPDEKYAFASRDLTAELCRVIEKKGVPFVKGCSWTTDAVYRGVSVSSVFSISDMLSEDGWNQAYHSEEKLEGLKQIFEAALETIWLRSKASDSAGSS